MRLNGRITYYLADVANAKRDIARGNAPGGFEHLAKQRIEDGERYAAEARFHVAEIRKASMDPHEAYAEENKNNQVLKRRLDELERGLFTDHERFERARTALDERRVKFRQQRELWEASTARLNQHSATREANSDPRNQIEAIHQTMVGQFQELGDGLDDNDKKLADDMCGKFKAMAAEVQATLAQMAAKRTAAQSASTAAASARAPAAPTVQPPPQETAALVQHAACPAADAGQTWAQTVAKQPATGALVTPQKPAKTTSAGTGSATKKATTADDILALDLTGGARGQGPAKKSQELAPNKRSRGSNDEDNANGMSDEEDADKHDSWM